MGLMREQFTLTLLFILFAIGFLVHNVSGACPRPVFMNPYAIILDPDQESYNTNLGTSPRCEEGHTSSGFPQAIYCGGNGAWDVDISDGVCYAECNITEIIQDDDIMVTNDNNEQQTIFDHGEVASFTCSDKGQFTGSDLGTCDNGTLLVAANPTCLAYCPVVLSDLGVGLSFTVADTPVINETTTIYYRDGDEVTYSCTDGYGDCTSDDCTSTCVDGSWDPPEIPVCVGPSANTTVQTPSSTSTDGTRLSTRIPSSMSYDVTTSTRRMPTTEIDECSSTPCQNNATCEDRINGYRCQCAAGFNGTNCEENINDCVGHACQNGGTCVDKTDSYECQCPDGFNGYRCENEMTTMVMMTTAENVTATESGLTTVTDNVTITTSDASTVTSGASTTTPDASTAISDGTSHIPTTNQATTVSFTTIPEITTSATALPETTEASSNQSTSPEAKETTATKPTTSTTTPDASTAISDGTSHIPTTNQATTVSSTTIPEITTSATALPETTEASSNQSTSPEAKETTATKPTTPRRTEKPQTTPLPCKGECLATQVCNVRNNTCEIQCRSGYYEDETDSEIPCKEPVSIDVTLTITEVNGTAANFTEELNNSTSKEFKELESKVCQPFNEIYADDPEFVGCQVLNFSQGSIKVNYVLKFAENSTQNPSTVNQTIQDDLVNPNGSFADEFTIDPDSLVVEPLNECNKKLDVCDENSKCIDEDEKGYTCKCNPGYEDSVGSLPGRDCIERTPTEPQTTEPQPTEPKTTKEPEEPGLVPWKVIVGVTVPIVGILTISTIGLTCWQYRRQHRTSPSPSKKLNTFPYDDDYEEDKRNSLDRESGRPGSMRIINSDGTVQEVVLPWRNFAPEAEFVFGQDNNKRETQLLPMVDYPNEYSGSTSDENDPMRNIHGAFDNYTYEYHDTRKNTTEIDHSNFF
ncbi:mucin-17-like isoform X8 [Lytechinus variegatus]|uniref:mucin-17-like isoform X8 n=1 Tax=Lytechinus variegatus TaxID=7654 RepID=UPI001BB29B45|nr:mucin-17-like isoform X8 [Lytechinus variegatus]